jgi:hypothetical protein
MGNGAEESFFQRATWKVKASLVQSLFRTSVVQLNYVEGLLKKADQGETSLLLELVSRIHVSSQYNTEKLFRELVPMLSSIESHEKREELVECVGRLKNITDEERISAFFRLCDLSLEERNRVILLTKAWNVRNILLFSRCVEISQKIRSAHFLEMANFFILTFPSESLFFPIVPRIDDKKANLTIYCWVKMLEGVPLEDQEELISTILNTSFDAHSDKSKYFEQLTKIAPHQRLSICQLAKA